MVTYIESVVLPQMAATEGTPEAAQWQQAWVRLASAVVSTSDKDNAEHIFHLVRFGSGSFNCVALKFKLCPIPPVI